MTRTMGMICLVAAIAGIAGYVLGNRSTAPMCPSGDITIIGDSNVFGMYLGRGCTNLGVGGDTSRKMIARFSPKDIAVLHPILVIWTPSNEVHDQTHDGIKYIQQMVRSAKAVGLRVIVTTPLPLIDKSLLSPRGHFSQKDLDNQVEILSSEIRNLASSENITMADVHKSVVNSDGTLNSSLFLHEKDGTMIHLNASGYRAVWRVLKQAEKQTYHR